MTLKRSHRLPDKRHNRTLAVGQGSGAVTRPRAKIIVLGSTNTDLVLRTEHLPKPGQTVLGKSLTEFGGGKGANQAVAAQRAGGQVIFIGAIGDDYFGLSRRAELEFERIDLTYLRTVPKVSSGVALILVDEHGENMIGVAPGANHQLMPTDIERLPKDLFQPGDFFVAPWETPTETIRAALQLAKNNGATTIFNPAPVGAIDPHDDWLGLVDVLILNEHELGLLNGQSFVEASQSLLMITDLHDRGVLNIVVTLGDQGHLLSQDRQMEMFPPFPAEAVDTVGAGDTFVGALACRLAERATLRDAARWASAAAALAVTRPGAQAAIPTRDEVDLFLARVGTMTGR
jgi:ribokinase